MFRTDETFASRPTVETKSVPGVVAYLKIILYV